METLLYLIEAAAILVFAYSGLVRARQSGFDLVGVLTIGFVTAFGGGTIRDVCCLAITRFIGSVTGSFSSLWLYSFPSSLSSCVTIATFQGREF
jgi:hypothetical protein